MPSQVPALAMHWHLRRRLNPHFPEPLSLLGFLSVWGPRLGSTQWKPFTTLPCRLGSPMICARNLRAVRDFPWFPIGKADSPKKSHPFYCTAGNKTSTTRPIEANSSTTWKVGVFKRMNSVFCSSFKLLAIETRLKEPSWLLSVLMHGSSGIRTPLVFNLPLRTYVPSLPAMHLAGSPLAFYSATLRCSRFRPSGAGLHIDSIKPVFGSFRGLPPRLMISYSSLVASLWKHRVWFVSCFRRTPQFRISWGRAPMRGYSRSFR
ncbi:hypothetical protein B0H10DRAFT_655882 [Mycena sp. CBHHK59/15]|nr:hypothetical protein B0H10DRAFT_655882 [Mycena sp. CBHHK59/15]